MKNAGLLTTLALILLWACQKDKEGYWPLGSNWKGLQTYGTVYALRNGEQWEGSSEANYEISRPGYCSITTGTLDPIDSVGVEALSFVRVPLKPGKYAVYATNLNGTWPDSLQSLYAQIYYDLVNAVFYPDPKEDNWILVEEVDSADSRIKGRFDVTYRISKEDEISTNYPRVVHFSEGRFDAKIR
jgi:hypothetical protein